MNRRPRLAVIAIAVLVGLAAVLSGIVFRYSPPVDTHKRTETAPPATRVTRAPVTSSPAPPSDQPLIDGVDAVLRSQAKQSPYAKVSLDFPEIMQRIGEQRASLRKESMQQSLDLLCDVRMFLWPGMIRDQETLSGPPLDPSIGAFDVQVVLANRRVLKLIEELGALGKAEAGTLVASKLNSALPRYEQLFESAVGTLHGADFSGQWVASLENAPDGSPRLMGARYEVLSLLFIAGQLQLTTIHQQVAAIAEQALAQRRRCYAAGELAGKRASCAMPALAGGGLYSRSILVKAMIGTAPDRSPLHERLDAMQAHATTYTVTGWDAAVSTFDQVVDRGVPPDFSRGRTDVQILRDLADEDFDSILDSAARTK